MKNDQAKAVAKKNGASLEWARGVSGGGGAWRLRVPGGGRLIHGGLDKWTAQDLKDEIALQNEYAEQERKRIAALHTRPA